MASSLDDKEMKKLFKEAVTEALQERRDLFYDVMAEVMEDLALARAIEEGLESAPASKDEVLAALKGEK